ncbi:hypothetical protein Loa_02544 [Legionella oakridgensis ATCC 33761 = DSM 21215]|uniref:Uncharacterized protein n=1 Tax=Legionella oakridgensis ATCC 33761 = DSM 21215 TaxID=1268635 RepID=W0BH77_9GAMM|nr:hypothetical protein [Legionella oakridgensis]AHE68081.1 hypothetical protein Loa_02544 [Legionella oakridgensis ATCC 33761 = DSM 21215]
MHAVKIKLIFVNPVIFLLTHYLVVFPHEFAHSLWHGCWVIKAIHWLLTTGEQADQICCY